MFFVTGADDTANDGVYTEYFTQYDNDGRYSIDILVNSNGSAVAPSDMSSYKLGVRYSPYLPPGSLSILSYSRNRHYRIVTYKDASAMLLFRII